MTQLGAIIMLALLLGYHGVVYGILRRRVPAAPADPDAAVSVPDAGPSVGDRVALGLHGAWLLADVVVGVLLAAGVIGLAPSPSPSVALLSGAVVVAAAAGALGGWVEIARARNRRLTRPQPILDGAYGLSRHPGSLALVSVAVVYAILLPLTVTFLAAVVCVISRGVHVRRTVEPRLIQRYGKPYVEYRQEVGRFIPGVGRAKPPAPEDPDTTQTPSKPSLYKDWSDVDIDVGPRPGKP